MKHSTMFLSGGVCSPYALVSNAATVVKALILSFLLVMCGTLTTSAQLSTSANDSANHGPAFQPTQEDDGGDSEDEDDDDEVNCGPFKIRVRSFEVTTDPAIDLDYNPGFHSEYSGSLPSCNRKRTIWTGGYINGSPATVSAVRNLNVPANATQLNFEYLALDIDNVDDVENSFIKIDGVEVFTVLMTESNNTLGYVEASVDLSAYAGQNVEIEVGNTTSTDGNIGNVFYGCFTFDCPPCESILAVACPNDATLECGTNLEDLYLTGMPSFDGSETCDGEIEASHIDVISNQTDCGYTVTRTWIITLGDLTETCTQILTIVDTQGPVFPELLDVNVQCLESVEGPIAVEALDACSGPAAVETYTSQTGEVTEHCVLSTAFGPGADWAVWLPVLASASETSSANFVFDSNGGFFDQFLDGTAHLYGTVENTANTNEIFVVDLWFENKADWATWSGLGRNYKNDLLLGCATLDHINWEYFELVGGFSTLTGAGDLAGDVLSLYHMPSSYYFGFQKGIGANNKNCNSGLSGWFSYDGFVNGNHVEGHGDVNVNSECEPGDDGECIHNTSFTHFYRAEDACGHATIASYDVIVEDTTAPEFSNCPESLTIECDQAIPALALDVTATDNCSGDVLVSYLGEETAGDACLTTLTRTWAAFDICGNRADCVQTITIVDTTAPVLNGTPEADITVECDAVPAAAVVTATDNCQDVVEVIPTEVIEPGNCPGNYTIYRSWYASDSCDNDVEFNQVIHVQDTTAPVFDPYEFYAHIECDEIPALITATDNCGSATVVVTNEVLNSGGCLGVYYRLYTATDECGNTATAEQYIAIQDLTAPELVGVPVETTLECSEVTVGDDGNYFGVDGVYGVDNCEMEVTVTYTEEVVGTDDDCEASFDVIRTWVGIDYCENDTTVSVVFHIVDTTAPELWIPSNYTAECDEDLYYGEPSATDNCSDYTVSEVVDTLEGNCPQNYVITRTFVATDACGNASEPQTQEITVQDTTNPTFGDDDQMYYTFECDEEVIIVAPDATDNCGIVSYESYETEHLFDGPCYEYYTIVTVATDECGNYNEYTQSISIVDTTAPVITGELEIEVPCEEFSIDSGIFVEATDNCNEFVIVIDSTQLVSGECAGVYIRYYTAYDVCQNASEQFIQIIRLTDEIAPVGNEPLDIEVLCSDDIAPFDPEFTDNCGGEVYVEYVGFEVTADCNVTYTETWTAYDNCGNMSVIDRNVTIYDNVNPSFTEFPGDIEVSCDEEVPAPIYPVADDNCDEEVEIELGLDTMAGDCPQELYIYRTFRGYDNCNNQVVQTQIVHVYDNQAPVWDLDQEVYYGYECDEEAELIQPTATDNCGQIEYSYVDTLNTVVPCFEYFVRVWTATDECGNASEWFLQLIYFEDTTAPVITGELEIEVPCEEFSIDGGIFVEATDNCNEFEIVIDSTQLVSGECAGVYIRYYTAYDICQNASEQFIQIIRLTDEIAPVGNEPLDITVNCNQAIPEFDPEFTDNCGGEVYVDYVGFEITDICGASYTETWTATDNCGNETVIDRVVTVVDNNAPYLSIPSDYTAECDEDLYFGSAYASDSCDMYVDITEVTDTVETDCPSNYTITRTFTATDDCGNEATAVQTITVEDTTDPIFGDYVDYYEFECDEDFITVLPTATDACSDVTYETVESEYSYDGPCFFFFTRTTTATDCAGNSAEAVVTIIVRDTTAPVITGELEIEVPCEEFSIDGGIFVEATDNCNAFEIVIDSTQLVSGECAGVYIRYYTAYDVCQNASEQFLQIIRLTDEIAPVGNEPLDITISCTEWAPAFDPEFTDNCGGEVYVDYVGFEITDICGASYTETWTAEDNCGNQTVIDRVVTVVDNNLPFIYAPEDIIAECNEMIYLGYAQAWDSCDWYVDITSVADTAFGDCPANYVVTITYTATDDCGNEASAVQTVTVQDTTAPSFGDNNQNEFSYECIDEVEVIQPEAWDACSEIEYSYSDTIYVSDSCYTSMARIWIATDACGNSNDFYQYITVYDVTAPVIVTELVNVYIECASEIPVPVAIVVTDNCDANPSVEVSVNYEVLPDNCGNQVLSVYYFVTDNCGNSDDAYYYIYVQDETAPVLEGCPADLVLACDDEIPAPAVVTATDNCGGSWEVTPEEFIMGEMPEEGSIADCDLITPALPVGNPCNYPYAWAMAMFNMPAAHRYYQIAEGELVRFPDGTAHVTATLTNAANPANGFLLDVWFGAEKDWSEWSTQGFPTSFKDDCGGEGENHEEWLYFLMQNNPGAELIGFGAYSGSSINLVHAPANNYFGYQLGNGANNYNGADNGFGGWFTYSGTFVNGQSTTSVSGGGDLAFELDCCPDYYIVRQWTATDCSGNQAESCIQYITFEGYVINDVQAPTTESDVVESKDLNVTVAPNPADDNTVFTFKSTAAGRAQLEVFDMAGAKVADVYNNNMEAGLTYRVEFNVNSLATGIYMFRITQNGNSEMGRLVISK